MALDKNSGKNIVINNCTFKWAKLGKPVSPFGTAVWEMSIHLDKKDRQIPELEAEGLVFKTDADAGTMYTTLKRKAEKPDGSANTPVTVVDTNKQPVDPTKIGNGSTGKVKLFKYNWTHNKKTGTTFVLQAVLVEDLVQYRTTGGLADIFDADDGLGGTVKVPASAIQDDF